MHPLHAGIGDAVFLMRGFLGFSWVPWPVQMCDISYSYMRHETFTCTGNTIDGDNCNATCHIEECGNGVVDVGEECDDGNNNTCDGCSSCTIDVCGDGLVCALQNEACDDGICACLNLCVWVRARVCRRAQFETWLMYMCEMTHACAQHDWYMGTYQDISAQHVANAPHTAWQRPVLWPILSFRSVSAN